MRRDAPDDLLNMPADRNGVHRRRLKAIPKAGAWAGVAAKRAAAMSDLDGTQP